MGEEDPQLDDASVSLMTVMTDYIILSDRQLE